VDVGSFFEPHAQTAKLIKPSEGSLYHPPPSAQTTAVLGVSLSEPRPDPANS